MSSSSSSSNQEERHRRRLPMFIFILVSLAFFQIGILISVSNSNLHKEESINNELVLDNDNDNDDDFPNADAATRIPVFYNVFTGSEESIPRVKNIVKEQFSQLRPEQHEVFVRSIGVPFEIENATLVRHDEDGDEAQTLALLWQYCKDHPNPADESAKVVYLHSKGSFHPKVKKDWGCLYTNDDNTEPTHMSILRERLKQRVRNQSKSRSPKNNSVYGYFHVRRGDSINDCDTSLEVLQDFLECSLNGTEATGKHVTFLLGSDEKDNAYRKNLIQLASNFSHVSMLDADKFTEQVIREAVRNGLIDEEIVNNNNFYVYELQKVLRREYHFSSIFLDKHRSNCPKCTPLLESFPSAWK